MTAENTAENLSDNLSENNEIAEEVIEQAKEAMSQAPSLEDEIAELKDKNLRLLAEMQNLRMRQQKDIKETREFAISAFAHDMITVLENLNRADESIPETDDEKFNSIREGIKLTKEEVFRILNKHGIERVAPEPGDMFDYHIHQALVQVPTSEFDEGRVLSLISAGYTLKERVLKPAMVAVAKKIEEVNPATSETGVSK